MRRRLLATTLALILCVPAAAQTGWTLVENGQPVAGQDTRGTAAHAIRTELEQGTAWLTGLGFNAPDVETYDDGSYQATIESDAEVDDRVGSDVIAVYRWTPGLFSAPLRALWLRHSALTSIDVDANGNLTDLTPDGDGESLASAVHEVFHGVQATYRKPEETSRNDWIWEGMAEGAMHEWMRQQGRPYELRETDYTDPLAVSYDGGYDREHFWLSIGDLLDPENRITYLPPLLNHSGDWEHRPLETLDAALRAAAAEMNAIGPYRGGLYDLYPQVLAQHTTEDHYYASSIAEVEIETPSTSTARNEIEPLSADAMRVVLDVDESRLDVRGIPVRFTLDVAGRNPSSSSLMIDDPRDDLHLIVGTTVAGRPAIPQTPFNYVTQVYGDTTLFVRVANMPEQPADTAAVRYELRIESEGYYGDEIDAEAVAAALPPGFVVNGPGPWDCRGGADARAVFDLMTPDELGRDVERMLPEGMQDMEDMMDRMEINLERARRAGHDVQMSPEQLAQLRERARSEMERAQRESQSDIDAAAAEIRSEQTTTLAATFIGQNGGRECQATLGATLAGREGGAQILPGAVEHNPDSDADEPQFDMGVFPAAYLDLMRAQMSPSRAANPETFMNEMQRIDDPLDGWSVCTMTDEERRRERRRASASNCPPVICTAGQLVLESAEQGRIAGSFQFEVVKWPEDDSNQGRCRVPSGRDVVSGHFNVASTDDGYDDNSLSGFGLGGFGGGVPMIPGAPILTPDE